MREFFDKLESIFKPHKPMSAGEDVVDTLVFFAIMALLLVSVL
jgi:hypothetical protein